MDKNIIDRIGVITGLTLTQHQIEELQDLIDEVKDKAYEQGQVNIQESLK